MRWNLEQLQAHLKNPHVRLALLATAGVLAGTVMTGLLVGLVVRAIAGGSHSAEHHAKLDKVLADQLNWADERDEADMDQRLTPVHEFFDEARQGTRAFAEDALGWRSKFKLAKDYFTGKEAHRAFLEERFAEHVFRPEQLEDLLESSVRRFVQHLSDVDAQLLVRLQADLEGLPYDALPAHVDREALHQILAQAMQDALASAERDFQGMVEREVVSFVASEVLSIAATRLATSAGILGIGAGSGTVTFGAGLIVGIIVDYLVSWAYEALYDPVGEVAGHVNQSLDQLERLIVHGDETVPGLESRLRDYAHRRAEARTVSIREAVLP